MKTSITASFFLMDDEMKVYFTQLEKKIIQLTDIVFQLVIPLIQAWAPIIVVAKLCPMLKDEDSLSNEEDEQPRDTKSLTFFDSLKLKL